MATWNKFDNITALNLAGSWVEGTVPTAAATTLVRYGPDLTIPRNAAIGASTTWGQLYYNLPDGVVTTGTSTISPTTAAVLTLLPVANFGGVGIWVGANLNSTNKLSLGCAIALGESQSWQVDAGALLTVAGASSVISGASRTLTKIGAGQLTLNTTNTFSGDFYANAGLVVSSQLNALGASTNVIYVASGAAIQFTVQPGQSSYYAEGQGVSGVNYGAIAMLSSVSAGRTLYVSGLNPALTFRAGTTFSGAIAIGSGTVDDLYLNMEATAVQSATGVVFGNSSYVVGNAVHLQSLDLDGASTRRAAYSFGSGASPTDALGGLGNNANAVIVEASGGILYTGTGTLTLNRSYTFLATTDATYYQINHSTAGGQTRFNGAVVLSGSGKTVLAKTTTSVTPAATLQFAGSLSGDADLVAGVLGSAYNEVQFLPGLVSTWTGALKAAGVSYGVALNNAVTFQGNNSNTYLDALAAGLEIAAASYTVANAPTLNFTGTNSLTLKGGDFTTSGASQTFNVAAQTLNLESNIIGTNRQITKSGAGTLSLAGNNTGVIKTTVSAGRLNVNSNGALGPASADELVLSGTTTTLDNTSAADVTVPARPVQFLSTTSITWVGTKSLTVEANSLNTLAPSTTPITRNLLFGAGTGTLRLNGTFTGIGTLGSTFNVGTAGTLARFAVDGACAWTKAPSIVGGYYQTRNSGGLGATATALTWAVANTGALELDGSISPPTNKSVTLLGRGPQTDGALRSVSGTNSFTGAIAANGGAGAPVKIQADAGTFTITNDSVLTTAASQPLELAAAGSATVNLNRAIPSSATTLGINPAGETGTVKLAAVNANAGQVTVSGGTCQVGDVDAVVASSKVAVLPTATLQTTTALGTANYTALSFGATSSPSMTYFTIGA